MHLELARIGSLLFIFADSPNDQNGSSSSIDTFATRLSAQPLIHKLHELDVPVLAFTGVQSLEGRARALQAGANEVLSMASSDGDIVCVVNWAHQRVNNTSTLEAARIGG